MHLFLYNHDKKVDSVFAEYPIPMKKMSLMEKRNTFGCYLSVKPDNSKLVITYSGQGKIEIFDFKTNKWTVLNYKGFPSLQKNLAMDRDNRPTNRVTERTIFSWEIRSSNKYIYVKVFNTNYLIFCDGNDMIRTFIPQIHVFTWSGKPVAILNPDRYYRYFDVSKDDLHLYAIDDLCEDIIIDFNLQGIF